MGHNVKCLYFGGQALTCADCRNPATVVLTADDAAETERMTDVLTRRRRANALALFQAYSERALASGAPPKGLEQAFAAEIQVSPSMWSQLKSSRPIGDRLARQIEGHCSKPAGWLDEAHADDTPTPAERSFLELALAAYRATNAEGRRALRRQLKHMQGVPDSAAGPAGPQSST